MDNQLLGVPYVIWGILCLALTIVWVFVWPRDLVSAHIGLRYLILRWFHALVWLLLALGALLAAAGSSTASSVAFLALPVYLVFMLTFITSKRNKQLR